VGTYTVQRTWVEPSARFRVKLPVRKPGVVRPGSLARTNRLNAASESLLPKPSSTFLVVP